MNGNGIAFIRVDIAKIRERRPEALALWMGRYTLELSSAPQIGAESNLPHIVSSGMQSGDAVVRIPAVLEDDFRKLFAHGLVEAPKYPEAVEAWQEANRALAHAITIPEGHEMRKIYQRHADTMLAVANAIERGA